MTKTLKIFGLLLFAGGLFTSCEKNLDYSRPANANTVKTDIDSAFSNLTQGADIGWAWKFPNSISGNLYPELMLHFDKDSTADVYSITTRGIIYDLAALRTSGTLTAAQSNQVLSLINAFTGIDDLSLREALEDPQNISFKNALVVYLPNYINFNGQDFFLEEQNITFNVNSLVQTSLTFLKSDLFPYLKEQGIVDFDFRLLKFSRDSILMSSYKNDLSNVNTTLYPFKQATVTPFVNASTVIVSANPLKANVTTRLNGTVVPVPAGYTSVMDFFYRAYNQIYSPKYAGYGFMYNGIGSTVQPAGLKDAVFLTPTTAYAGTVGAAPSGTILATISVRFSNGTSQNMEFVKN